MKDFLLGTIRNTVGAAILLTVFGVTLGDRSFALMLPLVLRSIPILLGFGALLQLFVVFVRLMRLAPVRKDDDLSGEDENQSSVVVVAAFSQRHEADIAVGFLQGAGISASVLADDGGRFYPGIDLTGARVIVTKEEAEKARGVLVRAGVLEE